MEKVNKKRRPDQIHMQVKLVEVSQVISIIIFICETKDLTTLFCKKPLKHMKAKVKGWLKVVPWNTNHINAEEE